MKWLSNLKLQLSQRKITLLLFFIYLIFSLLMVQQYGIIDQLEALKYTLSAEKIITGDYSVLNSVLTPFLSYIFFLIPFTLAGNVKYAIAVQILLSFSAALCIRDTCDRWFSNRLTGFLAMTIFLFNFFIQYWTIALYTESFFLSISTLLLYAVFFSKQTYAGGILLVVLALFVTFTRPQGILFVIPLSIYYLEKHFDLPRVGSYFFLFTLSFLVFLYSFQRHVSCAYVYLPIADCSVICGFPQKSFSGPYPAPCTILGAHQYLIQTYGPWQEIKLFIHKGISLFTFTRPYYSISHNLLIGYNYLLLIAGLIPLLKPLSGLSKELNLLFRIILLNSCMIGLTYDDWHGRYLSILMSVLILLAAAGFQRLRKPII